jgi:hypothetical protein
MYITLWTLIFVYSCLAWRRIRPAMQMHLCAISLRISLSLRAGTNQDLPGVSFFILDDHLSCYGTHFGTILVGDMSLADAHYWGWSWAALATASLASNVYQHMNHDPDHSWAYHSLRACFYFAGDMSGRGRLEPERPPWPAHPPGLFWPYNIATCLPLML